jgi:hypothetical protein
MSQQEGWVNGGGHKTRDDPWMSTVTTVSAFLAGFSLAAVVVIANAPDSFRWPGVAVLALTIGSVVLVGAAQGSRNGAYYYEDFREHWRYAIWLMYHGGLVALAIGLGAALAPRHGVGPQQGLRLAAAYGAFGAAAAEVVLAFRTVVKRARLRHNGKELDRLLQGRDGWQAGTQDGEQYWHFGADGAGRLVITPKKHGFLIYRADQDKSRTFPRIELVEQWLDGHDHEHAPADGAAG